MVEDCKNFDNVGEIIIVDNQSTYEPLLEWYKTNPCEIIYSENLKQCFSKMQSFYLILNLIRRFLAASLSALGQIDLFTCFLHLFLIACKFAINLKDIQTLI